MALNATIYKIDLQIADMDRHYYQDHFLTVALHPSETAVRMLVRIVAFALNAHENLQFTKGLSTDEEPDLWQKSLTGDIKLWLELGQPSLKRIRKACALAEQVKLLTFSGHGAEVWWQQKQKELQRFDHLAVIDIDGDQLAPLAANLSRSMSLQCTIQEGQVWIGDSDNNCALSLLERKTI